MRFKICILFLVFLLACAPTPISAATDCAGFDTCQSRDRIAVLAASDIAEPILTTAHRGALNFKRYFGMNINPIAIMPGGEISLEMKKDLKKAGYKLSLPWISAADKQALIASSIRKQVMEQTKGMPAAQQQAIIEMALAKAETNKSTSGEMSALEQGALTHELGHMWFIGAFQPEGQDNGGGHGYGGWAPDWLDETAAVLLENETLTASRRKAFKAIKADDLYPLELFLTMDHPALKSAQALAEKFGGVNSKGANRAIILTDEEADEFLKGTGGSDPANFYTQVRGFADYVMRATGDDQIFAKLATHLGAGKSFESWLSETDGLPDNMEDLTQSWYDWLAAR